MPRPFPPYIESSGRMRKGAKTRQRDMLGKASPMRIGFWVYHGGFFFEVAFFLLCKEISMSKTGLGRSSSCPMILWVVSSVPFVFFYLSASCVSSLLQEISYSNLL
ncbi:hypothetical protein F4775DRAFT_572386 [Biscogniauxia sp. FL1348]|nr:hypothetical protein F4775DRAFT_572386 [Biscogniauxia sp. FL1348]